MIPIKKKLLYTCLLIELIILELIIVYRTNQVITNWYPNAIECTTMICDAPLLLFSLIFILFNMFSILLIYVLYRVGKFCYRYVKKKRQQSKEIIKFIKLGNELRNMIKSGETEILGLPPKTKEK